MHSFNEAARESPNLMVIHGAGGGGDEPRQPVESPDSLRSISYAKIIDLLGEGEIRGLVDGFKSIYLNGTPLQNADGAKNPSAGIGNDLTARQASPI